MKIGGVAHAIAMLLAIAAMASSPVASRSETPASPPAGTGTRGWAEQPSLFKTGGPNWDKRWWIEKTARLLRGGEGLGPDDDLAALLRLPEEEIARRFMDDPRFGDTILDFNLYFLGFKPDGLKTGGAYNRGAFDFANAVSAAQALLAGGDYFKLFDLEGPLYVPPLRTVPEDPPEAGDVGLSQARVRAKAIGEQRAAIAAVLAFGAGPGRPNGGGFCDRVTALVARRHDLKTRLLRAFDDAEIFILVRGQILGAPLDAVARVAGEECDGRDDDDVDVRRLAAALRGALAQLDRFFTELLKSEPAAYRPGSVREFRPFDLGALPTPGPWVAFGFEQGTALANSSTNFNRKRAAYVLKRFFCDDVVAELPKPPPPQQHAGAVPETSCASCHNKLDPMAGFFRDHGWQFYDYSRSPTIVFDDLAYKPRGEYEAAWRSAPNAGRDWNIGYVRNVTAPGSNAYGRSLADLSRIIRTAPEVKRCLMTRLFSYIVAEGQMIESGYLDHLTREFERDAAVNSAAAMKNAIVRIATGETFRQRNPDARQCYDYAPGTKPAGLPPCRISFVLKKNCAGCHDSAQDGDGNLDLGGWILAPDGRNRTFPHLDRFLDQATAEHTLGKIVERLAARDPKIQMPKHRVMRADEREELMQWAQRELARIRQRGEQ